MVWYLWVLIAMYYIANAAFVMWLIREEFKSSCPDKEAVQGICLLTIVPIALVVGVGALVFTGIKNLFKSKKHG